MNPVLHVGVHPPAPQVVVPFALVQATPQERQLLVVLSGASQPSAEPPLQLPQFASQLPI
jgi:hypothetical protein